jgi:valyl-tRNA synthetase
VEPHVHNVGHAERDDIVLEPYLTWQWYLKGKPLAEKCLAAADKGELTFVNERDAKIYRHWLENIQDWCISRQLWWGHRIPAWYRDVPGQAEPEVKVGEDSPGPEWRQDEDILDTWFSSGLWPFVTQGWPNGGERFNTFYPATVNMNGRDILFFWDIRMVMMGLELTGKVPFKTIYTHGLILDEHGQKMSKSKGNVIDPMGLIEQYGADALRFCVTGICSPEDMRFGPAKVEQARNFCTKLWNAARFLNMQGVMHTFENEKDFKPQALKHPINVWLAGKLREAFVQLDAHLDAYDFAQAAYVMYHFTWGTFCDWYLELTKPLLAGGDDVAAETRATIGWAFEKLLRGLHPFIPFITEELWAHHTIAENTFLMIQDWPAYKNWPDGAAVRAEIDSLVAVIGALRQARTQLQLPPKARLKIGVRGMDEAAFAKLQGSLAIFTAMAGVEELTARAEAAGKGDSTVVVEGVEYVFSLLGLIDMNAERARLEREMGKQREEVSKIETLLGDAGFMQRAPKEKVEANQARRAELVENIAKMQAMLDGPYAQ